MTTEQATTEKKKIESLTPEQEAMMPVYRDKWIKIGLQTETYDVSDEKLRQMVDAVYAAGNMPPPRFITRVVCPVEAAKVAAYYQENDIPEDGKIDVSKLPDTNNMPSFGYGQHDASWMAFYEFFRDVVGLKEETQQLVPLIELSKHVGWWVPMENLCVVCERPIQVLLNDRNVAHGDGKPAIAYRNGFSVWAWNGLRFPEDLGKKWLGTPVEELDLSEVLKITDVNQRAAVINRVGMDRMLKYLKPKILDKDTVNGLYYELLQVVIDDNRRRVYLKMENPSVPGMFPVEGVPPETTSVIQALFYRDFGRLPTGNDEFVAPEVLT